jgi:hypothetical protein
MNIGQGFHSDDARGVTVKVEPADPINRLQPATFLELTPQTDPKNRGLTYGQAY